MKAESYSTVSQFLSDIRLVINNAKDYYMVSENECAPYYIKVTNHYSGIASF